MREIKYCKIRYLGLDTAIFSSDKPPTQVQKTTLLGECKCDRVVFLYPSLLADVAALFFLNKSEQSIPPCGAEASVAAFFTELRGLPIQSLSVETKSGIRFVNGIDLKRKLYAEKPIKCKQILSNQEIKLRNCEINADVVDCDGHIISVIRTESLQGFDGSALSLVINSAPCSAESSIAYDATGAAVTASLTSSDEMRRILMACVGYHLSLNSSNSPTGSVTVDGDGVLYSSFFW